MIGSGSFVIVSTFGFQMMESCIKQNNGIDIYIEYFEEPDEGTECEAPQTKTVGNISYNLQIFSCD